MCYYCHDLKHNVRAPSHKSINCRDPNNKYSRFYQGDEKEQVNKNRKPRASRRLVESQYYTPSSQSRSDSKFSGPQAPILVFAGGKNDCNYCKDLKDKNNFCLICEEMGLLQTHCWRCH